MAKRDTNWRSVYVHINMEEAKSALKSQTWSIEEFQKIDNYTNTEVVDALMGSLEKFGVHCQETKMRERSEVYKQEIAKRVKENSLYIADVTFTGKEIPSNYYKHSGKFYKAITHIEIDYREKELPVIEVSVQLWGRGTWYATNNFEKALEYVDTPAFRKLWDIVKGNWYITREEAEKVKELIGG